MDIHNILGSTNETRWMVVILIGSYVKIWLTNYKINSYSYLRCFLSRYQKHDEPIVTHETQYWPTLSIARSKTPWGRGCSWETMRCSSAKNFASGERWDVLLQTSPLLENDKVFCSLPDNRFCFSLSRKL